MKSCRESAVGFTMLPQNYLNSIEWNTDSIDVALFFVSRSKMFPFDYFISLFSPSPYTFYSRFFFRSLDKIMMIGIQLEQWIYSFILRFNVVAIRWNMRGFFSLSRSLSLRLEFLTLYNFEHARNIDDDQMEMWCWEKRFINKKKPILFNIEMRLVDGFFGGCGYNISTSERCLR